jgi:3-hydroxybutyryl-CoA dehydrogenase
MSTHTVGVIGGGTMGTGIAYVSALAGAVVTVVEPDAARAATMRASLQGAVSSGVKRGKLDQQRGEALLGRIHCVSSLTGMPEGIELAIETVSERFELKCEVLGEIAARSPGLIATNTSALSIDRLAVAVQDASRFLGMHFFNPVWSIRLIEIVRGSATSDSAIAEARAFAAELGKESLVVRDVPGFATSRLDLAASLEAMRMLESGVASAEDIDRAATLAYHHPVGPLRLSDIVGLDVRLDIARTLEQAHGPRFAPPDILIEKVARGELGQKSGHGFFNWKE